MGSAIALTSLTKNLEPAVSQVRTTRLPLLSELEIDHNFVVTKMKVNRLWLLASELKTPQELYPDVSFSILVTQYMPRLCCISPILCATKLGCATKPTVKSDNANRGSVSRKTRYVTYT